MTGLNEPVVQPHEATAKTPERVAPWTPPIDGTITSGIVTLNYAVKAVQPFGALPRLHFPKMGRVRQRLQVLPFL